MEQAAFVPSLIWVIPFARLCSACSALQSFRWQHLPAEVVGVPHVILAAISTGACFMGALTYIGKDPISWCAPWPKAGAQRCPGLGRYMLYSGAIGSWSSTWCFSEGDDPRP